MANLNTMINEKDITAYSKKLSIVNYMILLNIINLENL